MTAAAGSAGQAGVLRTLRESSVAVRVVLLGVFVNQVGAFVQLFLVLYLTARGFSQAQAGLALGGYAVGTVAGTLAGGWLADRLGPRRTIICGMAVTAAFTAAVTAVSAYPAILVAVALSGAGTQGARPSASVLLFELVPPARQVMLFAMFRTALNAGAAVGPLLAVWLSSVSWNVVFWADAVTSLAYCGVAAAWLPRRRAGRAATGDAAAEPQPGPPRPPMPGLLRDYRYLGYLALMLANGLVYVQAFTVLPLMLKSASYATWAYGTVVTVSALAVVACQLPVTRLTQKWPVTIAVLTGWGLLLVGYGSFGLPGGLAVVVAADLVSVAGQLIGGPGAFAYPGLVAPPGGSGWYSGVSYGMFGIGNAVGPALGVLLWGQMGHAFWGVCLLFGAAMAVPGWWGMKAGRIPVPADEEDGSGVSLSAPGDSAQESTG